jgi:putative salt-induced outer membrane protein
MRRMPLSLALPAVFAAAVPSPAAARPLPAPVTAMIEASNGDAAVVRAAKATNPDSLAEIDEIVDRLEAKAQAEREAKLAEQGTFDGWSGQGQVGGFLSSGNSDDSGLALGLGFAKETPAWRHAFKASADYQRSNGAVSKERYFAGYSGQRRLGGRAFLALAFSGERDRFAGFHSRFAESAGLGYRLVDRPRLRVDLEGGPALRQTDYISQANKAEITGHLLGNVQWSVMPETKFTQNAQAYLASSNSTFSATSALTTKLDATLSARASIDVRHETNPAEGREATDTTSRLTLVYSF